MFNGDSRRITANTTIQCHKFLGAHVVSATGAVLIDRGQANEAGKRIIELSAGEQYFPNFPVNVDDPAEGAQQVSAIRVEGTSFVAYVLTSP